MQFSPLWKIPLIIVHSQCLRVAMTPPTPTAKTDSKERARYVRDHGTDDLLPMPFAWGPKSFKPVGYAINALEILSILASFKPSIVEYPLVAGLAESYNITIGGANVYISSAFVLGIVLSVLGGYIRASCYRHMGRFFTFELTIQDEHKLITSGPYSIVRHPSYLGLFAFYSGSAICMFGPGSFWSAAGMWGTLLGMVLGGYYAIYMAYVGIALFARAAKEDEVLRKEFTDQWVSWSKKTPYRLIPFVY